MREILFRAKRIDNGEWREGYLFDDGMVEVKHYFVGGIVIEPYKGTACDDWNITGIDFCEVDPETICQYTGLKDKNGKRIWENDIVSFVDMTSTESGYYERDCIGQVVWDDEEACFCVTDRLSAESWEVLQNCYTVGNIFDNSELTRGE